MKPISWDSGKRFDDPNLRWGSPSYELEPGDPGYVPPAVSSPLIQTQKRKEKKMSRGDFVKSSDDGFGRQIRLLDDNFPQYGAVLGFTADEMAKHHADRLEWDKILAAVTTADAFSQGITAWKKLMRDGGEVLPGSRPEAPTLPEFSETVLPGIEARYRERAAKAKESANYSAAIGEALGLIAPAGPQKSIGAVQPLCKEPRIEGGKVVVPWKFNGHRDLVEGLEILCDRADGKGKQYVSHDTNEGYVDGTALPTTPTKWTYEMWFTKGESRVGQPLSVSVLVGG